MENNSLPQARRQGRRQVGTLLLAFSVYCAVSGGPFGLEPAINASGALFALLLILVLPFIWALPDALTTAELSSAIPESGGYVVWVHRAFGPFAAFLNAWWTWLYSLVDASIYPVMFVTYFNRLLQLLHLPDPIAHNPAAKWLVAVGVIVAFSYLNIRGAKPVGKASVGFSIALILPFALMVAIGFWRAVAHHHPLILEASAQNKSWHEAISAGLAVAMWNYLGWDSLSTIAGEVENPGKAFPRAMLWGLPLVAIVYLLPTLIGLIFVPNPAEWKDGSWLHISAVTGGLWIGVAVGLAGLISPIAQFSASLLGSSRIPQGLAEDGFLPRLFIDLHPKYQTPAKTIALSGFIFAILAFQSFQNLVSLNVILFSSALLLEGLSLLRLRNLEPNLPRPFRVPGGKIVLYCVALLPALLSLFLIVSSIQEDGWLAQLPTIVAVLSGPILYAAISRQKGKSTG